MNAARHAPLDLTELWSPHLAQPVEGAHAFRDAGFILALVFVLAVVLFALAWAFRRRWRRSSHQAHGALALATGRPNRLGHKRRKRRRPRQANPSRAQVGGLPPRRDQLPGTGDGPP